MTKAKIFFEVEVEINKDNPNDEGLSYAEIAEFACGGVALTVRESISKNNRPTKLTDARYEFTISQKCM